MSTKMQFRLKMALYGLVLVLAELVQTSVFGTLGLSAAPCLIPVAVVCIGMLEGAEKGSIFGLAGGCLFAWGGALSFYGAYAIPMLVIIGMLGGLVAQRFLLGGIQTALCLSIPALFLTQGVYAVALVLSDIIPPSAFFLSFFPECLLSLVLCLVIYPVTARISRIGGFHG